MQKQKNAIAAEGNVGGRKQYKRNMMNLFIPKSLFDVQLVLLTN